jgi:hypothetical protein
MQVGVMQEHVGACLVSANRDKWNSVLRAARRPVDGHHLPIIRPRMLCQHRRRKKPHYHAPHDEIDLTRSPWEHEERRIQLGTNNGTGRLERLVVGDSPSPLLSGPGLDPQLVIELCLP